jgi:hypothetical protein
MMDKRPLCEALYPRSSAGLTVEHIVYTEDVGSSSLSSPTTHLLENIGFAGLFTKFPVGSENLC